LTAPAPGNGVAITGPGGSGLRAQGPGALWLVGFLMIAASILYDGYLFRQDLVTQSVNYRNAISDQTALFLKLTDRVQAEHHDIRDELKSIALELKGVCRR
jgi:hypothetical protein